MGLSDCGMGRSHKWDRRENESRRLASTFFPVKEQLLAEPRQQWSGNVNLHRWGRQSVYATGWVLDGCGNGGLAFKLAPANQAAAHSEEEALGEDIEHDLAVINRLKEKKAKVPRRQTFQRIG